MGFEDIDRSSERGSERISEESFFLTEQKVLGELFGDDEAKASSWLLHDGGRNGALLREVTERYLRSFGDKADVAARIADKLRSHPEDLREAA